MSRLTINLGNALRGGGNWPRRHPHTPGDRPQGGFAEAYFNLGIALNDQNKFADAVAAYVSAIALKPDYAEAYSNLGNALQEQGKLARPLHLRRAIVLKPEYAEAHSTWAML